MAQPKDKKALRVYTRFSDNVTFIALVIGVAVSFIVCLGIYSYEFFQTQSYWEEGTKCIAAQSFQCLMDIRIDQAINKDLLLTTMGTSLSFIGVIFGALCVTLYKAFKVEPCNRTEEV